MTQRKYTTGKRTFQHLTKEKRAQIEILLRQGLAKTQIAKAVGIARSTLYRELARGTVEQLDSELRVHHVYFSDTGQRVYEENRKNSRPPLKLMKAQKFILYAEQMMLQEKMAPDPLCGRARLEGNFDETVCAKTLYNYIDQGLLRVKNIDLPLRVRRKRKLSRLRKHRRCYGESIDEADDWRKSLKLKYRDKLNKPALTDEFLDNVLNKVYQPLLNRIDSELSEFYSIFSSFIWEPGVAEFVFDTSNNTYTSRMTVTKPTAVTTATRIIVVRLIIQQFVYKIDISLTNGYYYDSLYNKEFSYLESLSEQDEADIINIIGCFLTAFIESNNPV